VPPSYRSRLKITAFCLSLLAFCLIHASAAQTRVTSGLDSIEAGDLRQKLSYIASEKFKGRGNGTPELTMAAAYIADIFQKNGLQPAGDSGSYYQHFDIYSSHLGSNNDVRIYRPGDTDLKLMVRTDFIPEQWSVSGTVSGPLQLIESGVSNRANLKGKIAVELEDNIVSDDPEFPTDAAEERRLEDAGAAGVVILPNGSTLGRARLTGIAEDFREDLPVRLTTMATVSMEYPTVPTVVLSSDIARELLTELRKPQSRLTATITVDVERKIRPTQNVLGVIEGSDSSLKNEVMVVGAHYDHDGEAYGQIWYGADDNGSGTAALLELAEAFGNGASRPARSVLLCAWAGEEKGLLGSRYYAGHPRFPFSQTVAMFQMDMIGRNEDHAANKSQQVPEEHASDNVNTLNVLGTAFSPDLKASISRFNSQTNLTLHFRYDFAAEDLMRRSDQWSFLRMGIPAIFFFTGLHPDYHTPRDTPEKINYEKLQKVTRLVYLTAFQIANAPDRPHYVKPSPSGRGREAQAQ
jgi:Zn-dependent M28 family amino/carboxypeptidase